MSIPIRSFQRALQRSNILSKIRTAGLVSRVDLAKSTGLSKASVTGVIADLIQEGLVLEKKTGAYEGGRRPILLAINPDGVHVMGVNISIGQIRVVIINFQAEVKASYIATLTRDYYAPDEIVEIIVHAIQACMWEASYSRDQISGVGVGIPGLVDSKTGTIRFLPNYGWENVAFRDMLRDKINHPVFIDNSSNNLAIAEHWYGNGKGIDNFLVITLENGVGAGSVVNGELMRGNLGIASEFGHMCIDIDGPLCRCGRKGCVEAYAGNNALIREAKTLVDKGEWHTEPASPGGMTFPDVLAELEAGNESLREVYRRAGFVLGIGISNLITFCNPKLIIITGKGVQAGDVLFDSMYESIDLLKSAKFGSYRTEIVIQRATDGDWARESGTLVLQEIYKSPMMK